MIVATGRFGARRLGLALAQPEKSVVVISGDGEQLMGIGALGTVAVKTAANLTVVVLDNGHHGATGMQASHSSLGADLCGIAAGFGIPDATHIIDQDGYDLLAKCINGRTGTTFAQVHIGTEEVPRALPSRDGVANKNSFRASLRLPTF